jgi:hypothetical protein
MSIPRGAPSSDNVRDHRSSHHRLLTDEIFMSRATLQPRWRNSSAKRQHNRLNCRAVHVTLSANSNRIIKVRNRAAASVDWTNSCAWLTATVCSNNGPAHILTDYAGD